MNTTEITFSKTPVRRTPTAHGVIVSGGEWVATTPSGRTFTHTNKALVTRLAKLFVSCGENEETFKAEAGL